MSRSGTSILVRSCQEKLLVPQAPAQLPSKSISLSIRVSLDLADTATTPSEVGAAFSTLPSQDDFLLDY